MRFLRPWELLALGQRQSPKAGGDWIPPVCVMRVRAVGAWLSEFEPSRLSYRSPSCDGTLNAKEGE